MSRRSPSSQLSLHLPLQAVAAREDLIVSSANSHAVAYLDSWPAWPGPITVLAGPIGAGKTHLAQVWAARTEAVFLQSSDREFTQLPDGEAFVIEDLAQGSFSESWLFHVINAVRARKGHILMTSRRWPGNWGMSLPDLQSRMKLAQLVEVHEPDDELLNKVMVKLFSDRQLDVDPGVIDYLVTRMERSLGAADLLVRNLDELSLSQKRPITRPLAGEALRGLGWTV